MVPVFLCVLYLVLWSTKINAERRNLSEIRYHFTPCGAAGTLGPSYSECVKYYTSLNSPIIRDGVLTDTYSGHFVGSQSFRPPRDTTWNITIAGAAGGRGLCNTEYGRGLVQYIQSISLSTEYDYIIAVGQRGMGPCDTVQPDPGHLLCMDPPQTLNETLICGNTFQEWLINISLSISEPVDLIQEYIGGAGGGGASYVGNRERTFTGIYDSILGISAGGGGTSVELNYSIIRKDFPDKFINENSSDVDIYKEYIDAKPTPVDDITYSNFGSTGFKYFFDVQAGSGGGFSEPSFTVISLEDGRGLNMSERFAEGGTHCARNEMSVPKQLREAVGGFGAGGGGCREGGGGGGFTGGAVFNITAFSPGSGGYSFNNFSANYSIDQYSLNEGDGYVDIIAADCGCAYECVVYEEEDQFECLCPNDTQLAPNLNDCYYRDVRSISETTIMAPDPEEIIILKGISFSNSSCIFSVDVHLNAIEASETQNDDSDRDLCILMFVGEDNNIVLVTSPISVSGRVTLSVLSDDGILTDNNAFLDSPVLVTGAVLASTAECTINDIITFNSSIQGTENQDEVNFTKLGIDLYNMSHAANIALRELLQISEDDNSSRETTESFFSIEIIASIAIAVLIAVIVMVIISSLIIIRHKQSKLAVVHNNDTVIDLTNMQTQFNIELQMNVGYEVFDFGTYEDVPGSQPFTSRNGVNGTNLDFTDFNRSRSNTTITDWEYPRSNLVFLRDLGEGQFGKVMLMKAKNIAGCSGSVPVAVKTLSSRDRNVIQRFMDEVDLMKRFTHLNIVSLLGVCGMNTADDSAPLMILEYMPFGDLHGFLEAHRPTQEKPISLISEQHFYNFAIDVAEALNFLSSHKYVHRDIAARNCLVGPNLQIKIADFGLARGVYDKDYYRVAGQTFLPVRWLAPECLLYGVFTTASDVWAYGVLLWEITSYGMMPLNNFEAQEIVNMAQGGILRHLRPAACPKAMYRMVCKCHEQNQAKRPSFSDVIHHLGTVQEKTRTNS